MPSNLLTYMYKRQICRQLPTAVSPAPDKFVVSLRLVPTRRFSGH